MLNVLDSAEFYRSFIDWYVVQTQASYYLEIGCHKGGLTGRVAKHSSIIEAIGVDIQRWPDWDVYDIPKLRLLEMSSDDFFDRNNTLAQYDIIFIDADHSAKQVMIDFNNAVKALAPDGIILLHDTYPASKDYTVETLCGTACLARADIEEDELLQTFTFPILHGLTIVGRKLPMLAEGHF